METDFPTPQQMDAFGYFIMSLISALPRIALVIGLVVVGVWLLAMLTILILRALDMYRLLRQKVIFLELTPPALTDKTPLATQKLFSILHGLEETRSLLDKLLQREAVFTLEVPSTQEQGIRFVVRIAESDRSAFEKDIRSFSPDIRIRVVEDHLPPGLDFRHTRVLDFKLTNHFAYPLQTQKSLEESDAAAYLMAPMTQLAPGEQIVFQIVASPAKVRATSAIRKKILNNEHLLEHLNGKKKGVFPIQRVFHVINSILFGITDAVGDTYHGSTTRSYRTHQKETHDKVQIAKRLRPARTLSAFELELVESIHRKIEQPLFRTNIRALVVMRSKQGETERVKGIRNSLGSLGVPRYQSLKARFSFPYGIWGRYRFFMLKHRLPAFFSRGCCFLAASELAELYHFPHSETGRTENVVKSLSKTLPAPLALKGTTDFDVVLGRNYHHGETTDIGLTAAERERHVYIVGGTGNGKSTMLEYAIVQDIRNGKGVAVIDPHGDLARSILRHIPEERIKDVVYLNPVDIKYPIGLNLLELPAGLDADELLLEQQRVTEAIISVMRKVFGDDENTGAHRIEDMLRNSILTAMIIKDATLFTILKLLRNETYRKRIVADLDDEFLKDFWREEVGKAGAMQRVSMSKGVTTRIDRFRNSPSAKRILEQPKSTINFEDIINSGKILICNFAEGEIGEDTSALFGTAVLAELKMAAERRAKLTADQRRPFYVYVDEFQNFATESFSKMLSGSRKYKLFLTIAQQSTAQQETQRMTEALLSNLSTIICFRTGSPADEQLLISRFEPYLELGEISNLPTYNFYARLSAITSQEPVSGTTILLKDKGSEEMAQNVIAASRANYAKEYVAKKLKKAKPDKTKTDQAKPEEPPDDENLPEMDAPATA
jgi:hypothetical protein